MRWALDALNAAGLVTERGAAPYTDALARLQVRLIGAGSVGYQIARVLVASGLGTLSTTTSRPTRHSTRPLVC